MKLAPKGYSDRGFRTALSERIFLDRYALKAETRDLLKVGDTVIFTKDKNAKYPTREIGVVIGIDRHDDGNNTANLVIRDGDPDEVYSVNVDHIDLPLELDYKDMSKRVAKHIASVEVTDGARSAAAYKFEEILSDKTFVPAGRILSGAGAPGILTFFNCFVLPSPSDNRSGIIDTAKTQFET
jgi:ribonucleoside-diphosphate reductase alpha chain